MKTDQIRLFAISSWIRQQRKKLREQERETPREYVQRESHFLWGKRYLLEALQVDGAPAIALKHNRIVLQVRPGRGRTSAAEAMATVDAGQETAGMP